MKILCVANQKGGVGKSTLTVHLAYAAMEAGKRVLLVDMDKQGSLSLSFPSPNDESALLASDLYIEGGVTNKSPQAINKSLSLIKADNGLLLLDKAENIVIRNPAKSLKRFSNDFDICIIDTPPLLGIRLMAALTASDFVLTPVSVGLYELGGMADLFQTIHVIRTQGFNLKLKHIGILPIKINNRSKDQMSTLNKLKSQYGNVVFDESLPERAPVRKAIASKRPVWVNTSGEGHLKAAQEWRNACSAILKRVGL